MSDSGSKKHAIARCFRQRLVTSTAIIVAGAFSASLAGAQTATPKNTADTADTGVRIASPVTRFDAVTSIATKTEKRQMEILGSVTTVNRDQIQTLSPSTLDDILKLFPGVSADGGPRSTAEQFNIRGLDGSRIVLRVEGARANFDAGHRGRVFVDPDILRSVAVVRGPSSIYGSGALGGVIRLGIVNPDDLLDPGKLFGLRSKFSISTVNKEFLHTHTAFGKYAGVGVLLNFSRRISGLVRSGRPVTTGSYGKVPFSKDNIKSGVAKLTFDIAPGHKAFFTYQIYNNDNIIPTAANTDSSSNIADRVTREQRFVLGYNFKPTDNKFFDLTARVYLNKVNLREQVVTPGTNFGRLDTTKLSTLGLDVFNTSRMTFASGAVRAELTYGVEYYNDSQAGTRNGVVREQYPDASSDTLGLYARAEFTIFDQFILSGSLRWDRYHLSSDDSERTDQHLSKSFGIGWRPAKWVLLYAKYDEAFRAPSLTETFARGVHFPLGPVGNNVFIPNGSLKPELAKGYEIGLKTEFRNVLMKNDRLVGSIAGYRKTVKDFIELQVVNNVVFVPFPPFAACSPCTSQSVNVANARISGFEATLAYTSPWVFASVSQTYMIGKNKTDGVSLRSIPAQKTILSIGTNIPPIDAIIGWRTSIFSSQNRVPSGTQATKGYVLHDIYASWSPSTGNLKFLKGFRLDLGVENIFNKHYRRHLSALPEAGRNFKFAVSYNLQFGS